MKIESGGNRGGGIRRAKVGGGSSKAEGAGKSDKAGKGGAAGASQAAGTSKGAQGAGQAAQVQISQQARQLASTAAGQQAKGAQQAQQAKQTERNEARSKTQEAGKQSGTNTDSQNGSNIQSTTETGGMQNATRSAPVDQSSEINAADGMEFDGQTAPIERDPDGDPYGGMGGDIGIGESGKLASQVSGSAQATSTNLPPGAFQALTGGSKPPKNHSTGSQSGSTTDSSGPVVQEQLQEAEVKENRESLTLDKLLNRSLKK